MPDPKFVSVWTTRGGRGGPEVVWYSTESQFEEHLKMQGTTTHPGRLRAGVVVRLYRLDSKNVLGGKGYEAVLVREERG